MNSSTQERLPSLALAVGAAATFLSFLDTTVTNLAMPPVAADFDVKVTTVAWIATAYVIPFAAFLAPAGVLADAVGRARLFRIGIGAFTLFSLLIAVAPTWETLLAARALQGAGAALMLPASLAVILADVPVEKRRVGIGLWSASGALAAAAGPALGGVVVEYTDWRVLFCLNVPIGLWALWAARPLRTSGQGNGQFPDVAGSILLAVGIGAVVYGLTEAPERGWTAPLILTAFGAAVVGAIVTALRSRSHSRPALRLDLLGNRDFAIVSGISTAYGVGLFSTLMLGVLFLVNVWGYSSLQAGLAMTPAALVTAVVALGVGRFRLALSPGQMIGVGALLQGAATALLATTISTAPHFWTLWVPLGTLLGVGVGLMTVGIQAVGALVAPPQHFAAATGLLMASRQLGGALGIAISAVLLVEIAPETVQRPYAGVYWFATGAALIAVVGAALLRSTPTARAASTAVSTSTTSNQAGAGR